jgi:peptide/nickel transport system permease protein
MWTRSDLRFQLRRASGTLKVLLRNRRATLGLVLLVGFVFAALGAPILAPVQPTLEAGGPVAQPEWVTMFPDGYYLSKNMVVVNDPGFGTPAAVQAWSVTTPPLTASSLFITQNPSVKPAGSAGSLQMAYVGNGPANTTVSTTFQYPYHGPPKKYEALIQLLATGQNKSSPVHLRLFIARGSDIFNLVEANMTNGSWSGYVESFFIPPPGKGFPLNPTPDMTAGIVFSATGSYTYGVELDFQGKAQVNISGFQLNLLGSAYGILGTDAFGHDLWSQNVYGARISLFVGLLATFIGISLGLVIGLLAGFLGKIVDETLMRFTDMMLVIPALPLLLVLISVLGRNLFNVIVIIGFLGWMGFARIVRSQVLSLRERPFVEAAKAAGAGNMRIISRHIFPNIVSLTYVNLALAVPAAILTESALAFLGLSDPSVVSWGNIYQQAEQQGALTYSPPPWWWLIPPGLGIAGVSLSFVLIGFALDEIFNPRLRRRR